MKRTIILSLATITLSVFGSTFDTQDQFSIGLPDNWTEIPKDVLDEFSDNVVKLAPQNPKQIYDYGYQLSESKGWLQYPYILVQVKNVGRVASGELKQYKKLEEGFAEGLDQVNDSFSDIISNASFGETVYDEGNKILWTTISMDVEGSGLVKAVIAVKLTEKGIIQFNAYATEATFDQYAQIYRNAFIDLDIAESITYNPQLTDNAPVIGGINMGKVLSAGIRGAIIGGIIGLFAWVSKKKKKKHS
jgi:hypothetical protein